MWGNYQILIIILIILASGLLGGWAGYLTDPVSSRQETEQLRKHIRKRYLVLGVIAAASVPLFLRLLQSALIDNIFNSKKDNIEIVPFADFLVFTGFCLIAAFAARTFLDTINRQVMRDVSRANERAGGAETRSKEAASRATHAEAKAKEAHEIATDLVQEWGANSGESNAALVDSADDLPAETTVPELSSEERKALLAMMKRSFRTATGIGQDTGVPRMQIGELLDLLQSKGLVERTISPSTGGPRWRITPIGIRASNAKERE